MRALRIATSVCLNRVACRTDAGLGVVLRFECNPTKGALRLSASCPAEDRLSMGCGPCSAAADRSAESATATYCTVRRRRIRRSRAANISALQRSHVDQQPARHATGVSCVLTKAGFVAILRAARRPCPAPATGMLRGKSVHSTPRTTVPPCNQSPAELSCSFPFSLLGRNLCRLAATALCQSSTAPSRVVRWRRGHGAI